MERGSLITSKTGRILHMGPFPLGAGEIVRMVYQVAVGLESKPGVYEILAVLKDNGYAAELSNRDTARLLVVPDPELDQGLLLGKVFCDKDKDGRQDRGEVGVAGAKVYLDNGTYALTDRYGKYHLRGIDPGLRLVKIDVGSLRPGSKMTTAESRVIQFTRGLPAKVSFGVTCRENWVGVQTLAKAKKKKGAKKKDVARRRKALVPVMTLAGDLQAMSLSAKGRVVPLVDADLLVAQGRLAGTALRAWDKAKTPNFRPRAKGAGIVFNLRARQRVVLGWRLSVWRLEGEGRILVRRFSAAGPPPAQVVWDGRRGRRRILVAGGLYGARLDVVSDDGAGATSPMRVFGYGAASLPPAGQGLWGATAGGRALRVDTKGRFGTRVGRPASTPLVVELRGKDGRRTWVRVGPRPPVDYGEPPERLKIEGNVQTGRLVVDGKVIDTSLLASRLKPGLSIGRKATIGRKAKVGRGESAGKRSVARPRLRAKIGVDRRGRPKLPIALRTEVTSSLIQTWRLRIEDASGRVRRRRRGLAPVPSVVTWDGRDDKGALVAVPGARFRATLTLVDAKGNVGETQPMEISVASATPDRHLALKTRHLFSRRTGRLLGVYRRRLKKALRGIGRGSKGPRYRLNGGLAPPIRGDATLWKKLIEGARGELRSLLAEMKLTQRVTFEVNAVALPPRPLVPKKGRRGRRGPRDRRRETLTLVAEPLPSLVAKRVAPVVRVDGQGVKVAPDGSFATRAKIDLGSAIVIDLRDAHGAR
ncbi:MAG: hypothetical protein KAI47_24605, partial [Deltaproteobacteria bacterium]|nr:hypothetical protein [Deltaproteobacteria bacterium]